MVRVYSISVPDGYDLDAMVRKVANGRTMTRSAAILDALESAARTPKRGGRIDDYARGVPVAELLQDRPHDELFRLVRSLVSDSPERADTVRSQADTLVKLIDYARREPPGPPGVS